MSETHPRPLSPGATVPEVVRWLWDEIPHHSGRRGTKALTEGLSVAAVQLSRAAGLDDDAAEPLWDKHDIAAYLGIQVATVNNWVKRRDVPVAGTVRDQQGRVSNRYRPADVRAADDAGPGKGNRAPRKPAETAAEPPEPPEDTKPLPEHFREVLDYLVAEERRVDPTRGVYCWAVGKADLYHLEYNTREWVRSAGSFLYTTLKAMENRGLVTRHTRHEQAIRGPSTRYTVAQITDAGRHALATGRIPKHTNRKARS